MSAAAAAGTGGGWGGFRPGKRTAADLAAAALVVDGAAFVVWAYRHAATSSIHSYDPIFWAGMLLAYLAVTWRALAGRAAVLWLALLGLFTVLPKFWMSPGGPIYYDETAHFSLLRSVIAHGRLFQNTPLLPIGKFYPGMESAAATIHWLSGLSAWDSALLLIAVAHCLLPVQIYYIARALPISHRWAVAAAIVYATNPSFLYEDVQFAYESFAILLMLTIIRLYVEALAEEQAGARKWRQSLTAVLLIALMSFGCVVTHHLTSLTGAVLLLIAALTLRSTAPGTPDGAGFAEGLLSERKTLALRYTIDSADVRSREQLDTGPECFELDATSERSRVAESEGDRWRLLAVRWLPVAALAGCFGLWVAFVVPDTIPYLFPHVSRPFSQVLDLVGLGKGKGVLRTLFSHSTIPGYERVTAIAAPSIISVALLLVAVRWLLRRRRTRRDLLWAIVLSAGYLVSLPLTLLPEGAAGAHRTWASTFVGVSLLPAALVILFALENRRVLFRRLTALAGVAAVAVLLVGNTAAGTPVDYRYPGPYRFGSDTLSVTPETLSLARWVRKHLPPAAHVVTDRFTAVALTARTSVITPLHIPGLPIAEIWYGHRPPTPSLLFTMERHGDDYLAIDLRDSQHVPQQAALFVPGEPARVPRHNLTRMAHWPWLRLLYSSRHYRLYRIDFSRYFLWYPFNANDH